MARNKIGLQVDGIEELMAKLDKIGGSDAMKKGVDKALQESKLYVNPKIEEAMVKANLPAGGKYSTGDTKKSIDRSLATEWLGFTGEIKIGFDFEKSGLKSIFLMYGTPKMSPVKGLKNAIYGTKTQKEITVIQDEALNKVIKEIMEG